ncbi:MAG: hypothetical protein PF689_12935 [Deltaproteobacteria bacterium]|jgi:hypothetical protein|nr:hypothetical protein [Deltaproteobacteria bacterium]
MYKLILVFALQLTIFTIGCKKPTCDVALKKAETCLKKENIKSDKNHSPIFLQICKKNKSKFDKCNKIKECTAFRNCISEAATNPEAVKEYNELYNIKQTEKKTEKEAKDNEDSQ